MTDKTEAQPEALRLADRLDLYATGDEHQRDVEESAAELRRQHAEIQQLKAERDLRAVERDGANERVRLMLNAKNQWMDRAKAAEAQLSARQAAPDGWRLVPVEPTEEMVAAAEEAHMPFGDMQIAILSALSAAPPPPEREPQKHDKNRELAETAMRFVDRAGDVHPGIDDADRICAEFHAAMAAVVDKWHPMPMPPGIGATND